VDLQHTNPVLDWTDPGFGRAFVLYLFLVAAFQCQYMHLYFVIGHLARDPQEIVRLSSLLRGTESAAQAVSYGIQSLSGFTLVAASSLNFGLWGLGLIPAWFVVREIGVSLPVKWKTEAGEKSESDVVQESKFEE
jgi:hypothetical protein